MELDVLRHFNLPIMIASTTICALAFISLFGFEWWVFWLTILSAIPVAYFIKKHILYNIAKDVFESEGYDDEYEENSEDESEEDSEDIPLINVTVVDKPEKARAVFKGAEIYDWLVVEDAKGRSFALEYNSIVNVEEGKPFSVPKDCVLLAPGIIYKVTPITP